MVIALAFLVILSPLILGEPGTQISKPFASNQIYKSYLPPTPENRFILVSTLDGTMHLVDTLSNEVLWSFSSGMPIYSSYQDSHYLASQNHQVSQPNDDFYVDCGTDWKLFKYYKNQGKERLNIEEYIKTLPKVVKDGVILGGKRTTVYRLDGKTGRVVQRYTLDDLNSTLGVQKAEVKTVALAKDAEGLVESVPTDKEMVQNLVYIMRKDYVMQYKSESGNVLWSVSLAEIEAEFQCREIKKVLGGHSSTYDNSPHSGYINNVFQLPCEKSAVVFRLRSHSLEEFLSVLDSLGGSFYLPYPDDKPYLGPADGIPLALPDNTDSQVLSLPPSKVEYHGILNMLSGNVTKMGSTNIFEKVIGPLTVLFSTFLSILGMLFYTSKQDKLRKEPKEFQVLTASKKKKTKKSGNNKNSINNGRRQKLMSYGNEHENSNGLAFAEGNEGKSFFTFSNTVDSPTDGRRIGKLLVSNKEIAKGSNGTVVLEGIYDGRPVAVKRLVQSHHGVALKEIQNLIASDQHPCIVRWYGVEYDQDFVYLALERCTCSLNDLIYVLSGSFKIQVTVHDESSNLLDEYTVRLNSIMENNKDIELWKANGYPSSHLLKLMRDVVSGVVHLHELGIIHRDLKPQNVLIIKDKSLWAKLSDMGISKRLPGDMTSLTQNATGSGSSGWQAPEQLRNGRQTRAVDLFSLGCVLFFCITGGRHPYGDSIERDVNIVNDRKDLFLIESMPEALDLLTSLLDPNPDLRPRARDVLPHPLFWTSEMRLSFLRDASDRVELEDREESSELLNALESTATLALNGKWDEKMESAFLNNIGRYRRYKFDSVRDLLRVIRNKLNHYRELPQEIQELLGNVPEGFDGYFSSRFPRLLIEVYKVVYRYCKEEEFFQKYIRAI